MIVPTLLRGNATLAGVPPAHDFFRPAGRKRQRRNRCCIGNGMTRQATTKDTKSQAPGWIRGLAFCGARPGAVWWGTRLFLMADRALDEIGIVLAVAALAEGVGGVFEGGEFFGHLHLAVMAGFAFFDFLSFGVGEPFSFRCPAVVAGLAFQPALVGLVGEGGRFRRVRRIDGRLQDQHRSALIDIPDIIGNGNPIREKGDTAQRHEHAAHQRYSHDQPPVLVAQLVFVSERTIAHIYALGTL